MTGGMGGVAAAGKAGIADICNGTRRFVDGTPPATARGCADKLDFDGGSSMEDCLDGVGVAGKAGTAEVCTGARRFPAGTEANADGATSVDTDGDARADFACVAVGFFVVGDGATAATKRGGRGRAAVRDAPGFCVAAANEPGGGDG